MSTALALRNVRAELVKRDESPRVWMEALESRRLFSLPAGLDASFGNGGVAVVPAGTSTGFGGSGTVLAAGPGGSIYLAGGVVGDHSLRVYRLNADGSPDESFGDHGIASLDVGMDAFAFQLLVQRDGKVLVESTYNDTINSPDFDAIFVRFNGDGSVDRSFGRDGRVDVVYHDNQDVGYYIDTPAAAFSVGADGKITVVGKQGDNIRLDRLNVDGTPDESFGAHGQRFVALPPAPSPDGGIAQDLIAHVRPDGGFAADVVEYGFSDVVMRVTGEYDFNAGGDLISATALDPLGPADVASSLPDGRALLYHYGVPGDGPAAMGSAKLSWLSGSIVGENNQWPGPNAMTVDARGGIDVVGWDPVSRTGAIERFVGGAPDSTFGDGGVVAGLGGDLAAVLALPDGSLVAVSAWVQDQADVFEVFKLAPAGAVGSGSFDFTASMGEAPAFDFSFAPFVGAAGTGMFDKHDDVLGQLAADVLGE